MVFSVFKNSVSSVPGKLHRTVLLDDLVNLHPAIVDLFHVRVAHRYIGETIAAPVRSVLRHFHHPVSLISFEKMPRP